MIDATPHTKTPERDQDWVEADSRSLLQRLLDAIGRVDGHSGYHLCKHNDRLVRESFESWLRRADDLSTDSEAYHRYLNCLYLIAKTMSDSIGDGRLFAALVREGETNPFARWERKLEQSHTLMGELQYDQASSLLCDYLIDVRRLPGFGYRHMTATTHWYASQAHFGARQRDDALAHCQRSLEITEEIGDHPRYRLRYLDYLMEIHRYFGEGSQAAARAEQMADFYQELKNDAQSRWHRSLAKVMRLGEPLTRVIVEVDGGAYELDELPGFSGDFNLELVRNRKTLLPALLLTGRARRLASQGKLDEALAVAKQAAEADPYDPTPMEEAGDLLLGLGEITDAAEAYEQVEQLAPGWNVCRTKRWLVARVLDGRYDEDLLPAAWKFLREELPPTERTAAVEEALGHYPDLALLHQQHGDTLLATGRKRDAAAAFARGLACECDEQVRTRLLWGAARAARRNSHERKHYIEEAADLNGDPMSGAMAKLIVRLGFPSLDAQNT